MYMRLKAFKPKCRTHTSEQLSILKGGGSSSESVNTMKNVDPSSRISTFSNKGVPPSESLKNKKATKFSHIGIDPYRLLLKQFNQSLPFFF